MFLIRALPPKAYEELACRQQKVEERRFISLPRFAEARSKAKGEAEWFG
jgi:hypothetical protein